MAKWLSRKEKYEGKERRGEEMNVVLGFQNL